MTNIEGGTAGFVEAGFKLQILSVLPDDIKNAIDATIITVDAGSGVLLQTGAFTLQQQLNRISCSKV